MAPAESTLDDRIIQLLHKAKDKELPLRVIEQQLQEELEQRIDTFAVRDAVWRLIDKRQVDFTLLNDLKVVDS